MKNIANKVTAFLAVVLMLLALNLYIENKELKRSAGKDHEQLVAQTIHLVYDSRLDRWFDTSRQNEEQQQLFSNHIKELEEGVQSFFKIENNIHIISSGLNEMAMILYKLQSGPLTEGEIEQYDAARQFVLDALNGIHSNLQNKSALEWYNQFTKEDSQASEFVESEYQELGKR